MSEASHGSNETATAPPQTTPSPSDSFARSAHSVVPRANPSRPSDDESSGLPTHAPLNLRRIKKPNQPPWRALVRLRGLVVREVEWKRARDECANEVSA
ncbi:hypothetical protein [Haladaptatus cibarius]|uniref:hypothetical protein n=1 Tax=Haladaptatus cibarius TaxID=453847 RepID=UPI001186FDB9|nr:hypothetical protein [Haladaptatus cibarius]